MSAGFAAAEELETSLAGGRQERRLSPWARLVAACVLVLIAGSASIAGLWAATAGTESTSFLAAAEVLGVELDVGRGNVVLVGGGLDEVSVRRTDHYAFDHAPEEVRTLEEGVIHIKSTCLNLLIGSCFADYRVTVSDNVPIVVHAPHGDIELSRYRGSAQLDTTDGEISVSSFCGFALRATAKTGSIDVTAGCSPDRLELRTDTGNVTASVPSGRYRVDAATTSGSTTVRGLTSSDGAPFSIQALSSSGNVTVLGRP